MQVLDRRDSPSTSGQATARRSLAVFTAIDATLLDAQTFEPGTNRAVLRCLASLGVPVVPISVMTLAELRPLARELGLRWPMIVEAGGAIARPEGDDWATEPYGVESEALLDVIRDVEDRAGARLSVYSALEERDAATLSGRSGPMLAGSTKRFFSEPFVIESGDLDRVEEAAADVGFTVRRGRRFLYLCRGCDEGSTFARVREELGVAMAIGIGGSPIDIEFLSRVDLPILVPRPNGEPDAEVLGAVPHARIAPAPAPDGWALALRDAIEAIDPKLGAAIDAECR